MKNSPFKISDEDLALTEDEYVEKQTKGLKRTHSWSEINDPEWLSAWQGNQRIRFRNAKRRVGGADRAI